MALLLDKGKYRGNHFSFTVENCGFEMGQNIGRSPAPYKWKVRSRDFYGNALFLDYFGSTIQQENIGL